ncbi:gluconokinase, GntK/IdnK-type (plasmid) [Variovorax sp. V213]|uniref:gluconokinase n=1 Tax=Variovorax sp. V213 TaxID=3065955 RepID=UPI0034E87913
MRRSVPATHASSPDLVERQSQRFDVDDGATDTVWAPDMPHKLLVMGVSGCGKSSTAAALAQTLGAQMIEGDDHHLPQSQEKMRSGIALDDEDRGPWLDRLGTLMAESAGHVVLACSALKRRYRERLRAAEPTLKIVYIDIAPEEARARVEARSTHWFPASLVDNQFATLEPPVGEPGVLRIDARWTTAVQCEATIRWLPQRSAEPNAQARLAL